jgi:arabinogalactan endo-1,4-beta-galactosidase
MHRFFFLFIILGAIAACDNDGLRPSENQIPNTDFISAVDISSFPEIAETNQLFYDFNNQERDFLVILKENSINTI